MTKTAKQIQGDVMRMLKASALAKAINGGVYRNGYRPRDSRAEDAIVTFTAGLPEQIQSGVVTVNIYFPDIDPERNGTWVEDGQRGEELEALAQRWVDGLSCRHSNYKFKLMQTIHCTAEEAIRQHFVVVKLSYDLFE